MSIKLFIQNDLHEPVVLKGYLFQAEAKGKWICLNWTKSDWLNLLGSEPFPVKFGRKVKSTEFQDYPQWDYLNIKGHMTYEEILKWENENTTYMSSCKTSVTREEYWLYLDYYYIKNLSNVKLAEEIISWETLDFSETKAADSTLWIGTEGANTPCHIDTYGSNIVCQIYGRKQWTLFPPGETANLYPTRIPYEESSIYSQVGFPNPNINKFPKLLSTHPYLVTLEAGDVLLVPKNWWHFVENLDFSISINTWVPLSTDYDERLKEAFVLYQIGSLTQSLSCTSTLRSIFNPNMTDILSMDSSELLQLLVKNVSLYSKEKEKRESQEVKDVPEKRLKVLNSKPVEKHSFVDYCSLVNKKPVCLDKPEAVATLPETEVDIVKLLIESFTDDRVISMAKCVLDENIKKYK